LVQASLTIAAPSTGRLTVGQAARVASTDCPVLITGETGVGKGYLARWMHQQSRRAGGPLVTVNCGAIPEDIIDSHLFGHCAGAFSDAHQEHPGLVRSAHGGTLLLDEVADLAPAAQLRLLRLLEEGEAQPVGSPRPVPVDVRVLAATRFDLRSLVEAGEFRADLYYRLHVIELHVPPLRDRMERLPGLLEEINAELAEQIDRPPLVLARDALDLLGGYAWPGNVRELRSVLERLHVMTDGEAIHAQDVREIGQLSVGTRRCPEPPRNLRLDAARQALDSCAGNITRAAAVLGVHRSTVHRWLQTA
jgi:DNA-binding NtrC family response regulator